MEKITHNPEKVRVGNEVRIHDSQEQRLFTGTCIDISRGDHLRLKVFSRRNGVIRIYPFVQDGPYSVEVIGFGRTRKANASFLIHTPIRRLRHKLRAGAHAGKSVALGPEVEVEEAVGPDAAGAQGAPEDSPR